MDIRKLASVTPTNRLHLRDANEELLYLPKPAFEEDGTTPKMIVIGGEQVQDTEPDLTKPVAVMLYGPGSKQWAKAQQINSNHTVDRLKKKGKADTTPEESRKERAEFLTRCTASWENMIFEGPDEKPLQGDQLSMAVYQEPLIGYIADQVAKFIGEWGNFSKPSTTNSAST